MHYNVEITLFQEGFGALADVFEGGGAGGDDMDYAEDLLGAVMSMGMGVVMRMVVGVGV